MAERASSLRAHRTVSTVGVAAGMILLGACAAPRAALPARAATAATHAPANPNDEPLPPELPREGGPAMNTEYFLGSEAEERAQFAEFARQIQALQDETASGHGQPVQRGFHAKNHGCLRGALVLDRHRDPRTRFGVFADGAPPHKVIVRFSNGVGFRQSDRELDARGMAIKVLDVPGPKYLPDETTTQDFLMTNSPVPVGRDAVEFMTFARANVKGRAAELLFLAGHAETAAGALSRTNPVDSMVTTRFWSGGAFHLGSHQAVKIASRPCDLALVREPSRGEDDYLQADLADAAVKSGICMQLYVQFQTDPDLTPIENASRIWAERDSPLVPVARVVLPAQTPDRDPRTCDQLAFSPWHSIPAHKPMGHINRARRYVYDASRAHRGGGGPPAVLSR
jgi:hypothetical protein